MRNEGYLEPGHQASGREEEIREFKAGIHSGKFRAVTNRGLRLGMKEDEVRRVLGKPDRAFWSRKFGAKELVYRRLEKWQGADPKSGEGTGMSWHNYYLFRGGRLYYIEFSQDLEGGA